MAGFLIPQRQNPRKLATLKQRESETRTEFAKAGEARLADGSVFRVLSHVVLRDQHFFTRHQGKQRVPRLRREFFLASRHADMLVVDERCLARILTTIEEYHPHFIEEHVLPNPLDDVLDKGVKVHERREGVTEDADRGLVVISFAKKEFVDGLLHSPAQRVE